MLNRYFAGVAAVLPLVAGQAARAAPAEDGARPSLFAGDLAMSIWTLLIFFLVVFVLGRFAWKPLLGVLQRREEFIRESLESARRDREAAEARLLEYEQRLQKAREEASALVEEGRRDAETVKRRIEEEARRSGEAMIERAKREIGIARDTALKQLYEESAQLATNLAGSLLQRQLTTDDHGRMVQEALAELRRAPGSEN